MTVANAAQSALVYVKESTFGTTPGSPSMLKLRANSFSPNIQKTALVSEERRTDGQIPFVRHGMKRTTGQITSEISYLALKDWIRAALRYDTTSGSFTSSAGTDTAFANATSKITRTSGSFVTDGAVVNMKIRVTGSTSNDGVYTITAVTALEITVSESLADEAATADVKMQGEYAENGTTETSFSLEEQFGDITQYRLFTGVKIGRMSMSHQTDSIPTITFDVMGKDMTISGTPADASADDVDTSEPVDTDGGMPTLEEGGSAIAIVTALDVDFNWNRADTPILGSSTVPSIEVGRLEITGTLTAYFQDATLFNKFLNETETTLQWELQDPDGNAINVKLPKVKYTGGDMSVSGDDQVGIDMPFQAYLDPTTGKSVLVNMITATAT